MQTVGTRTVSLSLTLQHLQHGGRSKSCKILNQVQDYQVKFGANRNSSKLCKLKYCSVSALVSSRHQINATAGVIRRRCRILHDPTPVTYAVRTYSQTKEQPRAQSTIDEEELEKFRALAESWWDEVGEFQALHTLNDLRVPLIRDAVLSRRDSGNSRDERLTSQIGPTPLKGNLILDVGCGGGILAEPLARLGATVIGIDATEENIPIAQTHASHDPSIRNHVKYIHGTAEDLVGTEAGTFDAVVASEVLEHVNDVEHLVATCVDLAKAGGSIIFTTINKTWASYLLAVVGAEDILRVVPHGTHDWEKFIPPEELARVLEDCGCQVKQVHGMLYNPFTSHWSWTDMQSCNYALHAIKAEEPVNAKNVEPEEEEIEHKNANQKR